MGSQDVNGKKKEITEINGKDMCGKASVRMENEWI